MIKISWAVFTVTLLAIFWLGIFIGGLKYKLEEENCKSFIFPNVTSEEKFKIINPLKGQAVYDTDNKEVSYWTGYYWTKED